MGIDAPKHKAIWQLGKKIIHDTVPQQEELRRVGQGAGESFCMGTWKEFLAKILILGIFLREKGKHAYYKVGRGHKEK